MFLCLCGPFPFHFIFHSGFDGLSKNEKKKVLETARERERRDRQRESLCVFMCLFECVRAGGYKKERV